MIKIEIIYNYFCQVMKIRSIPIGSVNSVCKTESKPNHSKNLILNSQGPHL